MNEREAQRSEEKVIVFNLESGKRVEFDSGSQSEEFGTLESGVLSADGSKALTIRSLRRRFTIRCWDTKSGALIGAPLNGLNNENAPFVRLQNRPIAFTDNFERIALLSGDISNQSIALFDGQTGKIIGRPDVSGHIFDLRFIDDQQKLAIHYQTAEEQHFQLFDANTGDPIREPIVLGPSVRVSPLNSPATHVSAKGNFVVLGPSVAESRFRMMNAQRTRNRSFLRSRQIHVISTQDGKIVSLSHPVDVVDVVFSPDGRFLLSFCEDGVARVWNLAEKRLTQTIQVHTHGFRARLSRDGRRLIVDNGDRARIWDLESGQAVSPHLPILGNGFSFNTQRISVFCDAAAQKCVVKGRDRLIVHDLAGETRDVNRIRQITKVLSGRMINELGKVEALSADSFRNSWNQALGETRRDVKPALSEARWHAQQAVNSEKPFAKRWHLDRLVNGDPTNLNWRSLRAEVQAVLGNHKKAVEDWNFVVEHAAQSEIDSTLQAKRANSLAFIGNYSQAALCLQDNFRNAISEDVGGSGLMTPKRVKTRSEILAYLVSSRLAGDLDAYRTSCSQGLRADPDHMAYFVARGMLLAPCELEFCTQLKEMTAQSSLGRPIRGSSIQWESRESAVTFDALLQFRQGKFDSLANHDQERPGNVLLLAMAQKAQGDHSQAKKLLAQAESMYSPFLESYSNMLAEQKSRNNSSRERRRIRPSSQPWIEDALFSILLDEAREMIGVD